MSGIRHATRHLASRLGIGAKREFPTTMAALNPAALLSGAPEVPAPLMPRFIAEGTGAGKPKDADCRANESSGGGSMYNRF